MKLAGTFVLLAGALGLFGNSGYGQQSPRAVVTMEPRGGAAVPEVTRDQISAEIDRKPAAVREWTHLSGANGAGANGALELYIAIDDGTRQDVANQYNDLRSFINSQPASTKIGVAYLQNGIARIAQQVTADHQAAAKALRIPFGEAGISASPYISLSDLFKKWPAAEARREVLLISSGVDPYYHSPDMMDPYLNTAVDGAVRGAIVVNAIYYAAAGHFGHSFFGVTWGQNYLSQVCESTGGEFYWQGDRSPVSFSPFMKDLATRLTNQYLLTLDRDGFAAGVDSLRVSSTANVSVVAPSRIYVAK